MTSCITLKTERLILRSPEAGDAKHIVERIGLRDVAWNLGRAPYPYALLDAQNWLQTVSKNWADDAAYVFAITHGQDGMIGCVGLDRHEDNIWEIGYWLGKPWWNKGFVSEASHAVLSWAETDRQITQFMSGHFVDNPASGKVLEKLGFRPVGVIDFYGKARGGMHPAKRYVRGAPAEVALRAVPH